MCFSRADAISSQEFGFPEPVYQLVPTRNVEGHFSGHTSLLFSGRAGRESLGVTIRIVVGVSVRLAVNRGGTGLALADGPL